MHITQGEAIDLAIRYKRALDRVTAAECKHELASAVRDAHAVVLLMIDAAKDSDLASGKRAYASGIAARDVLEKTAREFGFSLNPETTH